jgi:hypothetical protein
VWTLVLVLTTIGNEHIRTAIGERFPVKAVAVFSFAAAALLLLKCLGEILPTIPSNTLPSAATGYYTLVDQALDIGLLTPFCVVAGVLLLRREGFGYILSASPLAQLPQL